MDVRGADELARLAKALKDAGSKDLQRELSKGISRAMQPLKRDIRQSAQDRLPHHGGLAAEIAATKLSTRRSRNGLRLVGKGRHSLYHLNRGEVRHRRGGNITAGKVQRIEPGWWDKPAQAAVPDVRREVQQAMEEIVRQIDRRV